MGSAIMDDAVPATQGLSDEEFMALGSEKKPSLSDEEFMSLGAQKPIKSEDNGVVGSVEYDTSHRASDAPPGILTRTEDDGWMSGAAKGAATATMRGIAGIPGMIGNTRDFGRYLADRSLKFMGDTPEQIAENRKNHSSYIDDALDWVGEKTGIRPRAPNTDTFAAPVEEYTGRYDPESQIGRISQGVLEAGIAGLGPQGAVIKARPNGFMRPPVNAAEAPRAAGIEALKAQTDPKLVALNAGAATVGNTVTEFTGDPIYGFGASVLAGPAMHYSGVGAKAAAGPAWARFSLSFVISRLRSNCAAMRQIQINSRTLF